MLNRNGVCMILGLAGLEVDLLIKDGRLVPVSGTKDMFLHKDVIKLKEPIENKEIDFKKLGAKYYG